METNYIGPELSGYRSTIDEADLEFAAIASRESIYSYPIQTMVQEYINNGKDSNREAGNRDSAMNIHVPTIDEAYFSVRDYGVGLDQDGIINVYRKVYRSTKRDVQNLEAGKRPAGKYGVGAKIAFLYTDAFMITAYKNGQMCKYLAHKASSQLGDYTLIDSGPTNEPNGVEIRIELTESDHIEEFQRSIGRIFFLWDEKPNLSMNLEFPEIYFQNNAIKDYLCFPKYLDTFKHGVWLDVDGTPYKIDDFYHSLGYKSGYFSIFIKAGVDDVTIPMNRERVVEDNKLKAFLARVDAKIVDGMQELIEMHKSKTDFENLKDLIKYHNQICAKIRTVPRIDYFCEKIGRLITFHDKSIYLESKPEDKFTHKNIYKDKYLGGIQELSIYANKNLGQIKKRMFNEIPRFKTKIYTLYSGKHMPENLIEFLTVKVENKYPDLAVAQKPREKRKVYPMAYYNDELEYVTVDDFESVREKNEPIYYELCSYNQEHKSKFNLYDSFYRREFKRKNMFFIMLTPSRLKKLTDLGYTMIQMDFNKFDFSQEEYDNVLPKSPFTNIKKYTRLAEYDNDIREIINTPTTYNDLDDYPPKLRNRFNELTHALNNKVEKVHKKYPFMKEKVPNGVETWICSFLKQLSLQMENRSEELTIDTILSEMLKK